MDLGEDRIDLVVGEGAFGGAEDEAEGQALGALRQALALIDVEHADRFEGESGPDRGPGQLGEGLLHSRGGRRRLDDEGEIAQGRGEKTERLVAAMAGLAGQLFGQNGEEAGVDLALKAQGLELGEVEQPEAGGPAMGDVTGGCGLSGLPAMTRGGDGGERLAREIDPGGGGEGLGVTLGGVEIDRLAGAPAAGSVVLGLDKGGGEAFGGLPLALQEDAAGLEQAGGVDTAGLIELQGLQ